jgi:flagellar basal body-associated protein FliL
MAETETATSGAGASRLATTLLALNTLLLAAVLGLTLRSMSAKPAVAVAPESAAGEVKHEGEAGEGGKHEEAAVGSEHGAAAAKSTSIKLDEFQAQLKDDWYVSIAVELEVRSEFDVATLTPLLPRVRESFISYLTDRAHTDLRGSDGIDRVKRELLQRVDAVSPGKRVKSVVLSNILFQAP